MNDSPIEMGLFVQYLFMPKLYVYLFY